MNFNFVLFYFLTLTAFNLAEAKTKQVKSEKILKDLSSTMFTSFEESIKDKTLAVLFQPNCSSCKKQIKNLDCLKDITNKVILVGSLANEKRVRRSYLKKKTAFRGYYIEQSNLEKLGFDNDIAPQTIFYSIKKGLKFTGYKSCKKIKKKIEELYASS